MDQPNPIKVIFGILRVLRTIRPPAPSGGGSFDSFQLAAPLDALAKGGIPALADNRDGLGRFIAEASRVNPDSMSRGHALAHWINLYNAGAMALAVEAFDQGAGSVLRVPGAFGRPIVEVDGESLSLDAIEHAKLRRMGDPRIHGALVCGSLSCPTLRSVPYDGDRVEPDLDAQMSQFLLGGGAVVQGNTLSLSRIFYWYGRDFVSPSRMPTFIPASKESVVAALAAWLPDGAGDAQKIIYQDYDWGLACNIS